jgi:Ion channel
MRIVLALIGLAIVSITLFDFIRTTLTLGGAGPITARVNNALWKAMVRRHRSSSSRRYLTSAGPTIIVVTVLAWIVLIWGGWTLIFLGAERAVVASTTETSADFWSRVYFAGFSLFTLGLGDYKPQGALWQFATATAAANGFILLTLSVTYIVPVVSAAVQKRTLAAHISFLGETPDEILLRAWTGSGFGSLGQDLTSLSPMIAATGQQHLAYPVLHYFHSGDSRTAIATSVAALDEALTILADGVVPESRPNPAALGPARQALGEFLRTLNSAFIDPAEAPPPAPSSARLRSAGVPVVDDDALRRRLEGAADRRRLLLGLVDAYGWDWRTVRDGATHELAVAGRSRPTLGWRGRS